MSGRIIFRMNDIVCPHCKKTIHIDEVLRHNLEKTILKEAAQKQKEELEKVRVDIEMKAQKKFELEKAKDIEKLNKEKDLLAEKLLKQEKEKREFEEKITQKAIKDAQTASRLDKLEYEKKIKDMQIALEDAQRKSKQGSQQLQGEVLELDLEESLKKNFPNDQFVPIPKGVQGADIWQKVKFQGKEVGSIIWETKRRT